MKNNRLIKNTFLLILGGFITKILGFIIKILYTRYLKEEGVGLITLIFPTYSLLLTISSFSLPTVVTKFIAKNSYRKSKILFSSFWITTIINTILIIGFILISNYFATNLLHNDKCGILIKILCFNLPFVSTTSIIKAYFFGIENVKPIIFSNVFEEIIKLFMIIIFLPKIVNQSILYGASFYLIINLICEIMSFIILWIFLPKKVNISKLSYKYDFKCGNELLKTSFPILSGRLIGNLGYFFEPIILSSFLLYKGFSKDFIMINYGYFQGYVIQLLIMPSFFINALSSNMLPVISKYNSDKKYKNIKKVINKSILLITIGGFIFLSILFIYGKTIMNILYNTNNAYKYLKILIPFFILFYIENPIFTSLQALDQEKIVFKISTIGIILKYISMMFLILFNYGFYSLIYSEIINIIFVISLGIYYLKKYFYYSSQ